MVWKTFYGFRENPIIIVNITRIRSITQSLCVKHKPSGKKSTILRQSKKFIFSHCVIKYDVIFPLHRQDVCLSVSATETNKAAKRKNVQIEMNIIVLNKVSIRKLTKKAIGEVDSSRQIRFC